MKYFIGALMVALGVVMIIKTPWFIQNLGTNAWAEEKLGTSGGTRLMYKLIGLALIFVGMLVATSLIEGFLTATIGKLFVREI